jgi:phospholipid transport system substrate-binding protein
MPMLTRRSLITTASLAALAAAGPLGALPAHAQTPDAAAAFVDKVGKDLTGVVNGPGSIEQKKVKLRQIIDQVVDVGAVARFCLGRFWRTATPEQQKQYTDLFHSVLVINITGKVGDYVGVTFAMGRALPREGAIAVSSVVTRPGNAPSKVDWLVSSESGSLKIIDVIAEGTSLRLTQRSDYAAYLARNNNSVQALIDAMRQQVSQPG